MVFDRIDRGLLAWQVIAFVVIAVALGAYMALVTGPHLNDILEAGAVGTDHEPATLLDMHYMGFEAEDVTVVKEDLGEDGRSYYATNHLIADLFFPPALFLAVGSLFLWLSKPGRKFAVPLPEGVRLVVVALALAGLVADWGENLCLWIILGSEAPSNGLIHLGSTLTSVKFLAYSAALAALAATIILALIRGVSRQEPVRV